MTAIEWTDETWNPIIGCSRVSEGCRHCYAEQQAARIVRMGRGKPTPYDGLVRTVGSEPRWTGRVDLVADRLAIPLRWRAARRVFVNSMSDLFHESLSNEQIAAVFGVMAACSQHTFQCLTKRAARMREWFEWVAERVDAAAEEWSGRDCATSIHDARDSLCVFHCYGEANELLSERSMPSVVDVPWPLPNVWIGVSVENQDAAGERIPELLQTPATVRFLSCEPLLGPVDLASASPNARSLVDDLDWIIAGCESGPGARPCDVAWLRSLRDQCAAADVPFFLKQAVGTVHSSKETMGLGAVEADGGSHRKPGGLIGAPYLDGVQHIAFPVTR